MKEHIAVHLLNVVILLALGLAGAFPPAQASTLEPAAPAPASLALAPTFPAVPVEAPRAPAGVPPLELSVMDDPPLKVPFKLDLDMMLGPYDGATTWRVNQPASWDSAILAGTITGSPVAAVPAGGERFLAMWLDPGGSVQSLAWWPKAETGHTYTDLKLTAQGAPTLAALTPERVVALVRDTNDFIQARWWEGTEDKPWAGTWQQVPGKYRLGSDPVAVSKDSSHVALFFRDSSSKTVKLTEWQAGVDWRSEPLDLGNPPGTQIVSELAAVARNDRHLAVFGVGGDNILYCREWTTANKSDWSDTEWNRLMEGVVSNGHVSAASRHNNHMVVAVTKVGGAVAYQEWGVEDGWGSPHEMGSPGFLPTQSPTIATIAVDQMLFLGVDRNGNLKRNLCRASGDCTGWKTSVGSAWDPNVRVTPVVRRPHDLIVLGRSIAGPVGPLAIQYAQYTREFETLHPEYIANHRWGQMGGQTIATVQGKTVWLTAAVDLTANCKVAANETSDWSITSRIFLSEQFCWDTPRSIAVDAGDLDGDGDDEMVMTTVNPTASIDTSVVQISYGGSTSAPILHLTQEPRVQELLAPEIAPQQVDVAVGDLDGDGHKNEVVVAYNTTWDVDSPGTIGMYVYRYEDGRLQSQGKAQTFTPWTDGDKPPAAVWDFEIAIGQVRPTADDHEQVVLAVELAVPHKKDYDLSWNAYYYEWAEDARGDRSLVEVEQKYGFGPIEIQETEAAIGGAYSIALETGDIIGNGLDEVVFAHPYRLYTSAGDACLDCFSDDHLANVRRLAVGDLDGDSRAEILRAFDLSVGTLEIIDYADIPHEVTSDSGEVYTSTHLYATGQLAGYRGVPLLADMDGDSLQAELKGCDSYNDVNVIAVVNGVPRYYEGDEPQQENGGAYATGNTNQTGEEKGITGFFGGSIGVGYSRGKEGVFKASIKAEAEFLGRTGTSTEVVESTTTNKGEKLLETESRGLVVYGSSSYKCCQYDTYYPSAPDDKAPMLTCTPAHTKPQTSRTLEDWNSAEFKTEAGPSWVDVGRTAAPEVHRQTNDVFTYPDNLPVDPYLVKWHDPGAETQVQWSTDPEANPHTWGLEQSHEEEKVHKGAFENKYTLSAALEVGHWEFEKSYFGGFEKEWNQSIGWEKTLSFEGEVYDYPQGCPEEVCKGSYTVQPFLWQATATTRAGVTYPYLELDYFVPDPPGTLVANPEGDAAEEAATGIPPQQPLVNSPTHPDPGTWYTSKDVTLTWSQPAGDPAVVTGYRWNLNQEAEFAPTALHRVMTDTITFLDVSDGLHYLHLQARGDGGEDSPVARRAVRVDANPPLVEIRLDPLAPDGFNGWYKMPVEASVVVTDVAALAAPVGSGVATVEVSTDGTNWQPYTAPIPFSTPTADATLWARATDQAGHTSQPVSATLKIDLVPPTSVDLDGVGLSYHNVSTDELGNAQLMLGGASHDTLAGRFMVEVKAADTGPWRSVHAVGEFPIPPDNDIDSSMDTLNWVYTPTHEIRGIYPLWGRSVDAAGHVEEEWAFGTFWWEPDGDPDLSQSHASVAPQHAFPGDTVRVTLGIRNTGVQEAQVAVTDTLPAGLTPLPGSIGDGGQYDAGTGAIRWTLHGLWPGQTQFLSFDAQVDPGLDPTEPLPLENRLDLLGYWPWEPPAGGPPPPPSHSHATTATLTILPQAMAQEASAQSATQPPAIYTARVLEGAIVQKPLATLYLHTSADAEFLYVKEWGWDHEAGNWALANKSGWLPFTQGDNLAVSQDSTGKYGQLTWQLSTGDGVKYLGLWAANGDKHTTNLNEGLLLYTNLVGPSSQHLAAGQTVQYRLPMWVGNTTILALASERGDADLYVWKPRFAFRPHHWSNDRSEGLHVEGLGFVAEEHGQYLIEVHAAEDDSTYRLLVGGDVPGAASPAETRAALGLPPDEGSRRALPQGIQLPLSKKERPAHPLTLGTPYGLLDAEDLDDVPQPEWEYQRYLPLAFREG